MDRRFSIRPASVSQLPIIIGLIEEASSWLRGKDTDQWARPWPDRRRRDERVRRGLEQGATWIVWDGDVPAATMTIHQRPNPDVWPPDADDEAVYVHRLVVGRAYAGLGLGAVMLDWAVQREHRVRDVKWLRVDVWTTNTGLHAYYENLGFRRWGTCADPAYPSGALFQKEAAEALRTDTSMLVEEPPAGRRTTARARVRPPVGVPAFARPRCAVSPSRPSVPVTAVLAAAALAAAGLAGAAVGAALADPALAGRYVTEVVRLLP